MNVNHFIPKEKHYTRPLIIGLILSITISYCLYSCKKNSVDSSEGYQYEIPIQTDDGWETASLSSVGINETYLVTLMNDLDEMGEHRIHSLLIIRNGKLVFEEYFQGDKFNLARFTGETGFDMNDTHNLCSVTKSFTSALMGIAIDNGIILSVDQKVFDFFPVYSDLLVDVPEKADMTIEHLLTMTSGLEWNDETYSYFDSRNDMYQMFNSSDPIRYILSKDLFATPGTVFDYDNCNSNVLGQIISKTSLQRLDTFSNNYLFSKLGITDFEWQMLPNNVVFASGDLRLRPRDMAKFGLLFLNDGNWENETIVSKEWIDISTQKYLNPNDYNNEFGWADGYGYHWWQWENLSGIDFDAYFASGWGGQWIIVVPHLNIVVISTAGNYYTETVMPIESILVDYIIPSISQTMKDQ